MSLPIGKDSKTVANGKIACYQVGRILSYLVLGLIASSIGLSLKLAGMQQSISIVIGLFMVLLVIFPRAIKWMNAKGLDQGYQQIRKAFAKAFQKKNTLSFLWMGILNGLLPCGLLYVAISGALASADPWKGFEFMVGFGLGTVPMFFAIYNAKRLLPKSRMHQLQRFLPVLTLLFGVLLILRGCDLGIPFLSPEMKVQGASVIIKCH